MPPAATSYDRQYISAFSTHPIGLLVHKNGDLGDPDDKAVSLDFVQVDVEPEVTVLNNVPATREDEGVYDYMLHSTETRTPGMFEARWSFTIDGVPEIYIGYIEVGEPQPAYDALTPEYQDVVDNVWVNIADLFDSPFGGPNLLTYFQSNFGRGRIATLFNNAFDAINLGMQPATNYNLPGTPGATGFPLGSWGGLLRQAMLVETLKHIQRSYVEQPREQGIQVATLDRRDYMERWGTILRDEQADFRTNLELFKFGHLARPRVLVSGGVFPTIGPTRVNHNPAWPRYWARFF